MLSCIAPGWPHWPDDPINVRFDGKPVFDDVRREIIDTSSSINADSPG